MNTWLLRAGGIWNGFFTLFHALSIVGIQSAPGLSPDVRALLQMLNAGAILVLAFATFVSFAYGRDLLTKGAGKAALVLIAAYYGVRAVEEVVLSPAFSLFIFAACVLVFAIYATLLVRAPGAASEPETRAAGAATAS